MKVKQSFLQITGQNVKFKFQKASRQIFKLISDIWHELTKRKDLFYFSFSVLVNFTKLSSPELTCDRALKTTQHERNLGL